MLRSVAKIVSFVFHPLFLFVYTLLLLLILNPYMFGYNNILGAKDLLLVVTLTVIPIPMIAVLMIRALGWSETIYLEKRTERIAPFLITGLLYLSLYLQLAKTGSSVAFQIATLGAVLTIFGCFFFNNFYKISLHAAGAGSMVSMLVLAVIYFSNPQFAVVIGSNTFGTYDSIQMIYLSLLVLGLICTSRLILKQHSMSEIYSGLVLGFFSPLIAYYIVT